jgi:hypothetical protein
MKVRVDGKTITLTKGDFLASGGEGSVYVKRNTAFKIYADPKRMIPAGKMGELSVLRNKKIIKPERAIFKNRTPIGYTMRYVRGTYSLCQLFTKSFKDRHGITPNMGLNLVRDMQSTMQEVHDEDILIVDVNEMNFLSNKKFKEVYFIDVDSYQTKSYRATALMESVRDRQGVPGKFNKGTDWFSFAIITFQLMIGLHPYKGKHSTVKGLDARMEKNISVFNKNVKVPKSCMSLKTIPQSYRDWYIAVFEHGLREPPPIDISKAVPIVLTRVITGSDNFEIKELFECKWDIHQYARYMQSECVIGKGICFSRRIYLDIDPPCSIGFYGSTPIAARVRNGQLNLTNVRMQKPIPCDIAAEEVMAYEERLYVKSGENILEIQFFGVETQPIAAQKLVGKTMENASRVFPGMVLQSMLGSYYASVFPGAGQCVQHRLEFLDGYRVVDAKHEKGVIMVVGIKKGKYDRFVYDTASKKLRKVSDVSNNGLNFTVLDKGICVGVDEQERVEVFHRHNINKLKIIDDGTIHGGMKLFTDGARVLFADGKKLYSLRMK